MKTNPVFILVLLVATILIGAPTVYSAWDPSVLDHVNFGWNLVYENVTETVHSGSGVTILNNVAHVENDRLMWNASLITESDVVGYKALFDFQINNWLTGGAQSVLVLIDDINSEDLGLAAQEINATHYRLGFKFDALVRGTYTNHYPENQWFSIRLIFGMNRTGAREYWGNITLYDYGFNENATHLLQSVSASHIFSPTGTHNWTGYIDLNLWGQGVGSTVRFKNLKIYGYIEAYPTDYMEGTVFLGLLFGGLGFILLPLGIIARKKRKLKIDELIILLFLMLIGLGLLISVAHI